MAVFVSFTPGPDSGMTFSATLDGTSYQMVVTWNVFGQRWYLSCYSTNNERVFTLPLVGSPNEGPINLIGAYFQLSQMIFRDDAQMFEITP